MDPSKLTVPSGLEEKKWGGGGKGKNKKEDKTEGYRSEAFYLSNNCGSRFRKGWQKEGLC